MADQVTSDRKRILVVEDDEHTVLLLREEVEEEGYRGEVVFNGQDAVGVITLDAPDTVILDIHMPDKDGI